MQELIYYPGFEVSDPNWLKFALLYLDKLDPIIPHSGDMHLTEQYHRLMHDTDLIIAHRPSDYEGNMATLDALDQVEKVLKDPERYTSIFQNRNIVDVWKRPQSQNYTLFREKYTNSWEHFCIENGLARRSDQGLRLPRDLALLYMTILAQVIADSRGLSPITDHPSLDRFSIFIRRPTANEQDTVNTAQAILELKLPKNLSEISVEAIIKHRNKPGFKDRLHAFHEELDKFIEKIESGKTPLDFVDSFGSIWSDYSADILHIGVDAVSFGMGIWLLLQLPIVSAGEAAREVTCGIAFTIGSTITIRNIWRHTNTKRNTRKYLSNLQQLQPATF